MNVPRVLVLLALLVGGAKSRRSLVETTGPQGQISVAWDKQGLPDGESGSPDLPLDAPELVSSNLGACRACGAPREFTTLAQRGPRAAAAVWLARLVVQGFEPEGIHLTQWTADSVLVSWQTGAALWGSQAAPPTPYDPASVKSVVRWGTVNGSYTEESVGSDATTYTYRYPLNLTEGAESAVYSSPILHHALLKGLKPGTTYFYTVGDDAHGWSEELSFATLRAGFPLRIGMAGDLGQTANSSATLDKLDASNPDAVLIVGDLSYADIHKRGDAGGAGTSFRNIFISNQERWDSWARMTQPLLARKPLISCRGNHEIEQLLAMDNTTMLAAAARYPYPQDPSVIATGPNIGAWFLEQQGSNTINSTGHGQFKNESGFEPQSGFYSVDLPGAAHIVSMNTYLPWGEGSKQHAWLLADLAKVDRAKTPWLIITFHVAPYHTYSTHFKEGDTFMSIYEDIFYANGVDLVFAGHVHAYERTTGVYKYKPDDCGPMYTLIGDGGNVEGLYKSFIDTQPQNAYCANASLYQLPVYQPIPYAEPVVTLQDGAVCPTSQPAWSAYREPTFGHGVLELVNATHATWEWQRTIDVGPTAGATDRVTISKPPPGTCAVAGKGAAVPAAAPAPASGSFAAAARSAVALLLAGALAAAAALL